MGVRKLGRPSKGSKRLATTFFFRVSWTQLRALKRMARAEKVTPSDLIRKWIDEGVA